MGKKKGLIHTTLSLYCLAPENAIV